MVDKGRSLTNKFIKHIYPNQQIPFEWYNRKAITSNTLKRDSNKEYFLYTKFLNSLVYAKIQRQSSDLSDKYYQDERKTQLTDDITPKQVILWLKFI